MAEGAQSTGEADGIVSDDLNVNIGFTPKPPRPPKRHPVLDICALFVAAGLIATVAHSSALFGILWGCFILAYIFQYAKGSEMRKKSEGGNPPPE